MGGRTGRRRGLSLGSRAGSYEKLAGVSRKRSAATKFLQKISSTQTARATSVGSLLAKRRSATAGQGLFPVPGDSGEYEWSGYLPSSENPAEYNPSRHFIATANHNILPPGYTHQLSYSWAAPTRYLRIVEMLKAGGKFDVDDFAHMQQDTVSLPARDFLAILKDWHPASDTVAARMRAELLDWDCNVGIHSKPALIYEVWINRIHRRDPAKGHPIRAPRSPCSDTGAEIKSALKRTAGDHASRHAY